MTEETFMFISSAESVFDWSFFAAAALLVIWTIVVAQWAAGRLSSGKDPIAKMAARDRRRHDRNHAKMIGPAYEVERPGAPTRPVEEEPVIDTTIWKVWDWAIEDKDEIAYDERRRRQSQLRALQYQSERAEAARRRPVVR